MTKNKDGQMNIHVPEEVHETYSNLAVINHSFTEFVVDFIQVMPGRPTAKVTSRVILSPLHTKQLLKALSENVKRYEKHFGEIKEPEMHSDQDALNLFGTKGEA